MRHQVVEQIATGGTGSEDADHTVVDGRVVSGVLEGVIGGLQEQALLRVCHPRGVRGHPEEFRVELLDSLQGGRPAHVAWIGQRLRADPSRRQRLLGEGDDGFLTAAQVVPELRHGIGAGKPSRHPDHRDRVVRHLIRGVHCHSDPFRLRCTAPRRARARCCARAPSPDAALPEVSVGYSSGPGALTAVVA